MRVRAPAPHICVANSGTETGRCVYCVVHEGFLAARGVFLQILESIDKCNTSNQNCHIPNTFKSTVVPTESFILLSALLLLSLTYERNNGDPAAAAAAAAAHHLHR